MPAGVLGIGFGVKRKNGVIVGRDCLRIYVRQKVPREQLADPGHFVKARIRGIRTDIIPVNTVIAHGSAGESIGVASGNTGTLACLLSDGTARYLLSNCHVLAGPDTGNVGDPVYMPSLDQNGAAPIVATLFKYGSIVMGGAENRFDAAIAQLADDAQIDPAIVNIGPICLPVMPPAQIVVTKCGAATFVTYGTIEGVNEEVQVTYNNDPAQTALLIGQLAIAGSGVPFSAEGDSGSLVVDQQSRQPVGLLIGGARGNGNSAIPLSFASPLQPILDYFGMTIIT